MRFGSDRIGRIGPVRLFRIGYLSPTSTRTLFGRHALVAARSSHPMRMHILSGQVMRPHGPRPSTSTTVMPSGPSTDIVFSRERTTLATILFWASPIEVTVSIEPCARAYDPGRLRR